MPFTCIIFFAILAAIFDPCDNFSLMPNGVSNNFGKYVIKISTIEFCRGPKAANFTTVTGNLTHKGNNDIVNLNLDFHREAHIDEVKVIVLTEKQKRNITLFTYKVPAPCKHFVIAEILSQFLRTSDCVVKKGVYNLTVNLSTAAQAFIGPQFYYGNYWFRVINVSKKGNISCMIFSTSVKKTVK